MPVDMGPIRCARFCRRVAVLFSTGFAIACAPANQKRPIVGNETASSGFSAAGAPISTKVNVAIVGDHALVEGDIVLGTADDARQNRLRFPGRAAGDLSSHGLGRSDAKTRWPGGVIPFTLERYPFNTAVIMEAIETINAAGVLRLVRRTTQTDYVEIVNGTNDGDCRSFIGRQGGAQQLWLGMRCLSIDVVLHEIGHAAGLLHEHSRPDRDRFITVNLSNAHPAYQWAFNRELVNTLALGPYDFDSIMHYDAFAFSINGKPTITAKSRGVKIGGALTLSPGDVNALRQLYPPMR